MNHLRLRNWLKPNRRVVIFTVGSAAVIVKMAEVMIRITYKR